MPLPAGTRIGRYQVEAWVGSGGMGEVYRARDTLLGRVVAIKLLTAQGSEASSLEKEARTAAGLSHPHICSLHDLGEHEGRVFLVMEFIDGETLSARLRRGPLPVDQALRYGQQIAQALDAAHRHGVVHRDLKPSNVVLTASGAKLVDFGIAGASTGRRARQDTLTSTGEGGRKDWSGTVGYMAPERIRGSAGDERADVFALGVVLYEMLAGAPPFVGESDAAVGAAIVSDDPPPLPQAPPALQRLLERCLAKDPGERWQTAHDLVEAFAWLPAGDGGSPPRREGWRLPRAVGWGLAIAAALAAAVAGYRALAPGASPPLPVVVLMDSTLSERIYDPDTRSLGGTNSDDVTDALRDLPVVLLKEPTSALWHREEQILREQPSLVMMHLSSFARPNPTHESDLQPEAVERTRAFLAFVGVRNPSTRFLVYTRGFDTEAKRSAWVSETEGRFPVLKDRLQMFHVPGGDEKATFRDPLVKQRVREIVASTLGLPPKR